MILRSLYYWIQGIFATVLTREPLIFVFQGPSGMRKTWVPALNSPDFFYGPFFNLLNIFSHGVHQLPNYLSEYMVVAYQWMQNDERVLKNYISIISVYENRKINAIKREKASRAVEKLTNSMDFLILGINIGRGISFRTNFSQRNQ